ncbi:janus kinase and microtubule-interacting protein 2 [Platysternon megacephalum]|uniref:Janus kinase and microtubule-interacting protein 2 n=1 Tax=Platysternon megacephalum TaxID=55544 RepID=A0A4D9F051_9SAUR|nr:janus kinase and microtubule-interacting protein 2 [Platysternon megacephalum]
MTGACIHGAQQQQLEAKAAAPLLTGGMACDSPASPFKRFPVEEEEEKEGEGVGEPSRARLGAASLGLSLALSSLLLPFTRQRRSCLMCVRERGREKA